MQSKLTKAHGNWVSGERFYNRTTDLAILEDKVREGCHTMMAAQRRMGKTSLVRELLRRLEDSGEFITFFVDLESATTPEDAIVEIAAQTMRTSRMSRIIKQALEQVEELSISQIKVKLREKTSRGNWKTQGDQLFEDLASCDKPVVLALDELPIFIMRLCRQDVELANEWLSWFRKGTQQHQRKITVIILGSISLEPILAQYGLSSTVNNLVSYELKPWDEATAKGCLGALAKQYQLTLPEPIRLKICQRLRCCIPHHIQLFFDKLHDHLRSADRTEATLDDVDTVYRNDLLSVRGQSFMDHYKHRLKSVLEDEPLYQFACALLSQTANQGVLNDGMIEKERKQLKLNYDSEKWVMSLLEHDGYLERHDSGWRFVSRLLEDWWRINGPAIPRLKGSHQGALPR